MRMQRWGLSLVLCLGLAAIGCGDDDSATGNGSSGTSGGGSGTSGGGSGKTGGSSGSTGGNAGSGSSGSGITGAQAAAGACNMMSMMGTTANMCTGIDAYTKCAQTTCGLQACLDNECKDYVSCVQKASDPCNANCMQSTACTNCFTKNASCLGTMCISKLMCGMTTKGGACDMLDTCCAKQTDANLKMICMQGAAAARTQGDMTCMQIQSALCM